MIPQRAPGAHVRDRTLDPRPRAVLRDPMRDLEFHAAFNAASCYVRDPDFRVDFNTGYGNPCGVCCAVPGTSNECGISRGIQAVREHRDLLSNMEMMRKDAAGNAVTAQSAIDAINLTAAAMESLFDATTVAKTHVGLKE